MSLLGRVCVGRRRLDKISGPPYPYRVFYLRGDGMGEVEELEYHNHLLAPLDNYSSSTSTEDGSLDDQADTKLEEGEIVDEDDEWTAPSPPPNWTLVSPFRVFRPELLYHFWTTVGVIHVGKTVMVKRCYDGLLDNVYISRENVKSGNKTMFKIASFCLKSLIGYMEGILARFSISPFGVHQLSGTNLLLATHIDGNSFWNEEGHTTFHMNTLWIKPYLCD